MKTIPFIIAILVFGLIVYKAVKFDEISKISVDMNVSEDSITAFNFSSVDPNGITPVSGVTIRGRV